MQVQNEERGMVRELIAEREAEREDEREWRRRHFATDFRECPICEGTGVIERDEDEEWDDDAG